jgi:hypothetical protein
VYGFDHIHKIKVVDQDVHGSHQGKDHHNPNRDFYDLLFVINFLFHFISPFDFVTLSSSEGSLRKSWRFSLHWRAAQVLLRSE